MPEKNNESQYDALSPVLTHFPESIQRVSLYDTRTDGCEERSLCETQAAMLGVFATSRGGVSEVIVFDNIFDRYDLNRDQVLGDIDLGLERLNKFAEPNVESFQHVKSVEEIVWKDTQDGKIEFVAGVQALLDTEYGGIRSELVYNKDRLDDLAFAPQISLRSLYTNGIDVSHKQLAENELAAEVINPNVLTRVKLAITAAAMLLPKSVTST